MREYELLKKSMKDGKFQEIMGEYMEEISDPRNLEEEEQYFRQLEREGELKGVELVKTEEQFCLKTRIAGKDRRFEQVLYVNVCKSDRAGGPRVEGDCW